jgi:hypothetical protein
LYCNVVAQPNLSAEGTQAKMSIGFEVQEASQLVVPKEGISCWILEIELL